MIFRTDRKRLPWRVERLARPDRRRAAQERRPVPPGRRSAAGPPSWPSPPTARRSTWPTTSPTPSRSSTPSRPSSSARSRWAAPRRRRWPAAARSCSTTPTRSFNQWYSCNTCHSDGHTNGLDFDTLNDGRQDLSTFHLRSRKKVPTLRRVTHTGPWTWHGWQTSLDDAMVESFTKSMQGTRPATDDVKALVAYLDTLEYPEEPLPRSRTAASPRPRSAGEDVFRSAKAACNTCHGGPEFTDGKIHVAGLEEPDDAYRGYNPPSLRGVYDKDPYLHDGRSKTLRDALDRPAQPRQPSPASGELTDAGARRPDRLPEEPVNPPAGSPCRVGETHRRGPGVAWVLEPHPGLQRRGGGRRGPPNREPNVWRRRRYAESVADQSPERRSSPWGSGRRSRWEPGFGIRGHGIARRASASTQSSLLRPPSSPNRVR